MSVCLSGCVYVYQQRRQGTSAQTWTMIMLPGVKPVITTYAALMRHSDNTRFCLSVCLSAEEAKTTAETWTMIMFPGVIPVINIDAGTTATFR